MNARRPTPPRALAPVASFRRSLSDQTELRAVMAKFATGVTVITAGNPSPHGMTANSFTSVSLSPPMVLCCIAKAARSHAAVLSAGSFAVNILGAEQGDVARHFADWRRQAGMAQFASIPHRLGPRTGAPLLEGALGWIECSVGEVVAGGDHAIVLGQVLDCGHAEEGAALSFFGGGYHRIDPVGAMPLPAKDAM